MARQPKPPPRGGRAPPAGGARQDRAGEEAKQGWDQDDRDQDREGYRRGCQLVPPICSTRTADTPVGNACEYRSGTVVTDQCGPISRTNHGQTIKKA